MKITPTILLGVVFVQVAAFALSIAFWSNSSLASWIANTAWTLVALAFLSTFFEKRHCFSSARWKRTRSASVGFGIAALVSYLVATRLLGAEASDTSSALVFLGGLGPFMFVVRAFGSSKSTSTS